MQTRREFLERVAAVSVATASANAPLTSIAAPAVKPNGSARRTRGVGFNFFSLLQNPTQPA